MWEIHGWEDETSGLGRTSVEWGEPVDEWGARPWKIYGDGPEVVLYDLGTGCEVVGLLSRTCFSAMVVPWWYPARDLKRVAPAAIVIAGDGYEPSCWDQALQAVRAFLGRCPVVGIGLGHVIVGMAIGARLAKLSRGHWGKGIKVKDLRTGACLDTVQAHDVCLEAQSLVEIGAEITHVNQEDGTVEGFAHQGRNVFGVQFFDEGCFRKMLLPL
ncbi:MAG: glutamine amidotransferase-related protein [Bacillota bacterium]